MFSTTMAATVTMTIASPCIVTLPNTCSVGDRVIFTTTAALPTGIVAGTPYYVISAGFSAASFEISATPGGSAINTSGTQSGTHTATVEHVLTTDTNNATFQPIVDLSNMIAGDGTELHAYTAMFSGSAFPFRIWKGTTSNIQIDDLKAFPFIASDISLQMFIIALANAFTGATTFTNGSANAVTTGNLCIVDDVVQFTTSGTLPTNFAINTNYFVVSVLGTTITLSATRGGTAISAGSAGSGTHTLRRIGHTFPWKLSEAVVCLSSRIFINSLLLSR